MNKRHLIIFDGKCGMCRRTIGWIKRRDEKMQFETMPFQTAESPPMTAELFKACQKAVHVIKPDGEILLAGRAMLFILEEIEFGGFVPRLLQKKPFIRFVEIGYKIVAANRNFFSKFFFTKNELGETETFCSLPAKDLKP